MAELRSKKRNTNTYAKVSRAMTERGYSRDTEQCHTKIKELRQAYQEAREANRCFGSHPHTCRFYRELHAVMGSDATTTQPLSVDTCKGGVARSEEDEFLEDEEEEEEEADSAQGASGESDFPPSQELFLTLDGGVARSEEDEFLEDEEEEEADSAQGASGESDFPPSQELFLTLDPIASPHSQGMLPDHDPREGTSGE
ncbi:Zinc finger and SCAN domain-containing protein 29 [Chelonia mydas]|uniref:Zinc finger and SCAN domain-containing protein 29 n=1 Tax=Chelonia mydas TaxID=8469 RepID=M7AYA5_CHEMY|nr:Zinc finger and SCAN domain-containing protein 29 [Chelonia mydas]